MKQTTSIYTRNIPLPLKAQFKAYCARRGYTMEGAVMSLLRKAVREDLFLVDAHKNRHYHE